ncbi:MAG: glycosyltransferase family 4 protein [Burkholderiales bacterium]|nr:glycosyltransferase family 4 protein [Phycisphaerae bacterium]
MKTPRIALISGDFPPTISGIGDYTEKLAGAIARLGGDVTVVTSKANGIRSDYPFAVRAEMTGWANQDSPKLLTILRDYDIAHIQYPSGAYGRKLMINFLPRLIRKHCPNTRSLVTIHDFRVMRWRWRARVGPMLWSIDGLIHVDPRDGPYLSSWMPFGKPPTQIIPIAANAEPVPCTPDDRKRWRQELGFADDETVVAFFGVLYPHKGLPELHEAIRTLRSRGRKVRLLVMGDFDREADWRSAIENDLRQPHTVWVQGAPLDRVSQCLHASDMAALPFHSGASTNRGSMLATLAHGLPTVTTNGPCTPPDLCKQFDLSLVPIQSAEALTKALDELIGSESLRARMRQNSLEAMERMSWPTVARQTIAFYGRLLSQGIDIRSPEQRKSA